MRTALNYNVIIIDYETSLFDLDKQNIKFLYYSYQQILNNILYELNIVTDNMDIIMNYINKNIEFNTQIDINILLNYIEKLLFKSNNGKKTNLVYDPNI